MAKCNIQISEPNHNFMKEETVWENSIIMRYCGAAGLQILFFRWKKTCLVGSDLKKYHIFMILIVFLSEHENCKCKTDHI